ncbi:uncharacterized protein V6R79_024246 [Siganus canaliculatus]
MEPDDVNKSATDATCMVESVSFSRASAVANSWMFDFLFLSLCRRFKEGKLDEFNETLSAFEAISQSLKGERYNEKIMICAFLARVIHGKQLEVQFEEDAQVMPLMSAAKVWSDLETVVADQSLLKNTAILLLVQSVAVCLEKGQTSFASSALKWFEKNFEIPQNLGARLSTIVTKTETYHPVLLSFSFSRLLETVQLFLDAYLVENPSDYLLKAATKTVLSSQNLEGLEEEVPQEETQSEMDNNTMDHTEERNHTTLRTKRKLMPTKATDMWAPDSCKKAYVFVKRLSDTELHQMRQEKSVDTSSNETKLNSRGRRKWTAKLDRYLKQGVQRHGVGKWTRILLDYDFEGRTGTMLKDRWRVLVKAQEAG